MSYGDIGYHYHDAGRHLFGWGCEIHKRDKALHFKKRTGSMKVYAIIRYDSNKDRDEAYFQITNRQTYPIEPLGYDEL